MKTREEQRFHASLAFATVLLSAQRITGTSFCMAEAMEYADTLLAELDRTAPKPETPIPNADGWIAHRPGDAMPCDGDLQVFIRQKKDSQIEAYGEYRPARDWIWSDDIPESAKIIAWKPA